MIKKESLLLSIAKSNQEIVENTHSKPQETLNDQQLKEPNLDSESLVFVEDLLKAYFVNPYKYNEFIEKVNKLITNSYSKKKKLTRVDFTYLTKIIESPNQIYKERLNQEKIKQEKKQEKKIKNCEKQFE